MKKSFVLFLFGVLFIHPIFSQNRFRKTFNKINKSITFGKFDTAELLLDSLRNEIGDQSDFLVARGKIHYFYTRMYKFKNDSLLFHRHLDSLGFYSRKTNHHGQILNYLFFKSENNWTIKGAHAKDYSIEMLEFAQKHKEYYYIGLSCVMLSRKALVAGNDSLTRAFTEKGLSAIGKIKNKKLLHAFYQNYSRLHFRNKRYDSAMYYCNKSISHLKKGKFLTGLGQRYHKKGDIYRAQNDEHRALDYYIKSYRLFDSIQNKMSIQISIAKLIRSATYFIFQKDTENIRKIISTLGVQNQGDIILLAEEKIKTVNDIWAKKTICRSLADYFTGVKNYQKALAYTNQLRELLALQNKEQRENLATFFGIKEKLITVELEKENLLMKEQALVNESKLYRNSLFLLGLLVLLVIISSILITNRIALNKKAAALKLLESQNALLLSERENTRLQEKLEENKVELNTIILEMVKEAERLKKLYNGDAKKGQYTQNMDYWSEFTTRFHQVYPNFITALHTKVTNLSPTETKLAMLVLLNLSSKEASTLLAISPTSFVQGKYRLKKKMGLNKEESLYEVLMKVS